MTETFTHNCLKCSTEYTDDDPEPYFCKTCVAERKVIAQEIDKKRATIVSNRPQKSEFQIYEDIRKSKGTPFVNIKDLGITL